MYLTTKPPQPTSQRNYPDNWYKRRSAYQNPTPFRSKSTNVNPLKEQKNPNPRLGVLDNSGYSRTANRINAQSFHDPDKASKKALANALSLHFQYAKQGLQNSQAVGSTTLKNIANNFMAVSVAEELKKQALEVNTHLIDPVLSNHLNGNRGSSPLMDQKKYDQQLKKKRDEQFEILKNAKKYLSSSDENQQKSKLSSSKLRNSAVSVTNAIKNPKMGTNKLLNSDFRRSYGQNLDQEEIQYSNLEIKTGLRTPFDISKLTPLDHPHRKFENQKVGNWIQSEEEGENYNSKYTGLNTIEGPIGGYEFEDKDIVQMRGNSLSKSSHKEPHLYRSRRKGDKQRSH